MKILMKKYKYKLKDLLVCLVLVCLNPSRIRYVFKQEMYQARRMDLLINILALYVDCQIKMKSLLYQAIPVRKQMEGPHPPDKKKHRKQVMWFSVPGSSVYQSLQPLSIHCPLSSRLTHLAHAVLKITSLLCATTLFFHTLNAIHGYYFNDKKLHLLLGSTEPFDMKKEDLHFMWLLCLLQCYQYNSLCILDAQSKK